jgi:hypothetical protein
LKDQFQSIANSFNDFGIIVADPEVWTFR